MSDPTKPCNACLRAEAAGEVQPCAACQAAARADQAEQQPTEPPKVQIGPTDI